MDSINTRSSVANMATTIANFIKPPETYDMDSDVEDFILETERFFEMTNIVDEYRSKFVKAFLSINSTKKYELTNETLHYTERLRNAFAKNRSLIDDLNEALNYRQGNEAAEEFCSKIEKLAKNILKHKLDEEELKKFLLFNSLEDKEVKKDLKMQDLKSFDEMKERLKKHDQVSKEINVFHADVASMNKTQRYADAVKKSLPRYSYDNRSIREREANPRFKDEYTREPQHNPRFKGDLTREHRYAISNGWKPMNRSKPYNTREFHSRDHVRTNQILRCWACHEEGHRGSECPNIQCAHCKRSGHFKHQCHELFPGRRRKFHKSVAAFGDEDPEADFEYPNGNAPPHEEVIGAIN